MRDDAVYAHPLPRRHDHVRQNAQSHGGQPMAQAIVFQDSHPEQWVLTDNQGIYANLKSGFRWLCEDAIAPNAGVRGP